jgi:bisphosphoglycerate-independent phosphoglycerate mutase (AlkP superfamily)
MYKRMKEHSEIKWSEVARKAIAEYLNSIRGKSTTEEIRKMLPSETLKTLEAIPEEKAREMYKEVVAKEWERMKSLTRTS